MTTITIIDESTQEEKRAWNLHFLDETLSVREIIKRRIYQEVTEYNAKCSGCFRGLVQPTATERVLNGNSYHLKLPLEQIPPLLFSEVLRDVDLFVGVASIGNDPIWQDGSHEDRHQSTFCTANK